MVLGVFCFPCLSQAIFKMEIRLRSLHLCCRMLSEPRCSDTQRRIAKTDEPSFGLTMISLTLLKSYKYTLA